MFCNNCGAKISDNSRFCNQCGTKIGVVKVVEKVVEVRTDMPAAKPATEPQNPPADTKEKKKRLAVFEIILSVAFMLSISVFPIFDGRSFFGRRVAMTYFELAKIDGFEIYVILTWVLMLTGLAGYIFFARERKSLLNLLSITFVGIMAAVLIYQMIQINITPSDYLLVPMIFFFPLFVVSLGIALGDLTGTIIAAIIIKKRQKEQQNIESDIIKGDE